ncbi:hypothetical protein VNO77_33911 [Canavalia gladiata]|uniref:Uncharacterized protein n=1 Tax=Canavalia gladiata TaxID=3824 RepID=A0AAN9KFS8_CANGL
MLLKGDEILLKTIERNIPAKTTFQARGINTGHICEICHMEEEDIDHLFGLGHAFLASVLWYHAKSVDLESNASTNSFYAFIWKLLSAEYFLLPFTR